MELWMKNEKEEENYANELVGKKKKDWRQELFKKLLDDGLIEIKKVSYGNTIVVTDKFMKEIEEEMKKRKLDRSLEEKHDGK